MFERMDKDEIDSEKIIAGLKEEGIGVILIVDLFQNLEDPPIVKDRYLKNQKSKGLR